LPGAVFRIQPVVFQPGGKKRLPVFKTYRVPSDFQHCRQVVDSTISFFGGDFFGQFFKESSSIHKLLSQKIGKLGLDSSAERRRVLPLKGCVDFVQHFLTAAVKTQEE